MQRLDEVHEPIIQSLFTGKQPVKDRKPKFDLMGGGSGVGKSTLARKLSAEQPNSVLIDFDWIKRYIPEFPFFKWENLRTAWLRVHDESRFIAQEALARALIERYDVILDTCAAGPESQALAQLVKHLGYELVLDFVDCPIETAVERIKAAARVPLTAHYGRWMFRDEIDPPKPGEPAHDFPEGWKFVTELFADRSEYEAWLNGLEAAPENAAS